MDFDVQEITAHKDKPLTRADVERLLDQVGSSDKLNLRGRNMAGIDLSKADLSDANFSDADLSRANLSDAIMPEFKREQLRNRCLASY